MYMQTPLKRLRSCLPYAPTRWQVRQGPAEAAAQQNSPKTILDPKQHVQRGITVRGVAHYPEDHYKRHNVLGAAIPFSEDCLLLGFCHAVRSRREFCIYSLLLLSK
jgi:hypothetical protein